MWPIAGRTKDEITTNLTDFLQRCLGLSGAQIDDLGIERVERTGIPDNRTVDNELRIVLASATPRDFIFGQRPKLASYINEEGKPTAGFRVDGPDYLGAEWKLLDDLGFQLKRENGPGTRKYIKHDDYSYGFFLEIRLPGASSWTKILPEAAQHMRRRTSRGFRRRGPQEDGQRRQTTPPLALDVCQRRRGRGKIDSGSQRPERNSRSPRRRRREERLEKERPLNMEEKNETEMIVKNQISVYRRIFHMLITI